jgi:hypothetical protein
MVLGGSDMSHFVTRIAFVALAAFAVGSAVAGAVVDQFKGGVFGLGWSASAAAIEAKYPGGRWDQDEQGHRRYCARSQQAVLKLPAPHRTRELCFLIGADGTLASATARFEPTLPSLLAVVNRSRTLFGDFDSIKRDEGAVQSRYTYMLWTRDRPFLVQVGSTNDADGRPNDVSFSVADDATLHTGGADAVSHRPVAQNH